MTDSLILQVRKDTTQHLRNVLLEHLEKAKLKDSKGSYDLAYGCGWNACLGVIETLIKEKCV